MLGHQEESVPILEQEAVMAMSLIFPDWLLRDLKHVKSDEGILAIGNWGSSVASSGLSRRGASFVQPSV